MKQEDNTSFHQLLKLDLIKNMKSWNSVLKNKWKVKFSIYRFNILLIFQSSVTNQVIIKHFIDENEACEYINYITELDASIIVV